MLAMLDISNPLIGVGIGLLLMVCMLVAIAGLLVRAVDRTQGIQGERKDHDCHGHE
jgi:hypothetical protein